MMLAAQNGHSDVVETLLQYGASVDMQNVVRITIYVAGVVHVQFFGRNVMAYIWLSKYCGQMCEV